MIPGTLPSLDWDLDEPHRRTRRLVREFAEQEVAEVCEKNDREARFPYDLVAKLGELGLMGVPFPREYGGYGGDTLA